MADQTTVTANTTAVRVDGPDLATLDLPVRSQIGAPLDGPMETGWRELWTSGDEEISVGVWECAPGRFRATFPGGEFISVISGRLTVTAEGGEPVRLGPGDAMTFPASWTGEWHVEEHLRKALAGWRNADPGTAEGSTLIEGASVRDIELPEAPAIQTEASPISTRDKSTWRTADGSIETGIWECGAGTFHPRFAGYGECIRIVAGEVECTGEDGSAFTMRPGDLRVFPRGWQGTWKVVSPLRKLYTTWTAR